MTEEEKETITNDDMNALRDLLLNVKGLSTVSEVIPISQDPKDD